VYVDHENISYYGLNLNTMQLEWRRWLDLDENAHAKARSLASARQLSGDSKDLVHALRSRSQPPLCLSTATNVCIAVAMEKARRAYTYSV